MSRNTLLILIIFTFFSCKSTLLPPDQYKQEQLIFGSGGGFSGAYNEYMLLDDGRLYERGKDKTSLNQLKVVSSKITTQVFQNIRTFGLDKYKHNEPQNLYYFLEFKTPKDSNKIVWSGMPVNELGAANSIYKLLVEQTKTVEK
jgi:hypothetical protein